MMRNRWLIAIGLGVLLGMAGSAQAQGYLAGAARVEITPDVTAHAIPLGGYAARRGARSTGVHDPIYARAVSLRRGGARVCIVSLDLCFMPASIKQAVMAQLKVDNISLTDDQLFICATHTHCAPDPLAMHTGNGAHFAGWTDFDPTLLQFTAGRIAQAVEASATAMVPAQVEVSAPTPLAGMNRNRRGDVLTDPDLTVLRVRTVAGKTIALLVNFAAHPTLYDDDMLQISADWPGVMCASLEKSFPEGSVCLFLNGAEGDASPAAAVGATARDKVEDFGQKMSRVVTDLLKRPLKPLTRLPLTVTRVAVTLPPRHPNGLYLIAAMQLGMSMQQAKDLVNHLMPERTSISLVSIGSSLLIGFPCEPTAAVGLAAKRMALKQGYAQPMVVSLTNDWLAYAVTRKQYKEGKYETSMSFYGDTFSQTLLAAIHNTLFPAHQPAARVPRNMSVLRAKGRPLVARR